MLRRAGAGGRARPGCRGRHAAARERDRRDDPHARVRPGDVRRDPARCAVPPPREGPRADGVPATAGQSRCRSRSPSTSRCPASAAFTDDRQHAVSLAFVVPVTGTCEPRQDALELTWMTPAEAASDADRRRDGRRPRHAAARGASLGRRAAEPTRARVRRSPHPNQEGSPHPKDRARRVAYRERGRRLGRSGRTSPGRADRSGARPPVAGAVARAAGRLDGAVGAHRAALAGCRGVSRAAPGGTAAARLTARGRIGCRRRTTRTVAARAVRTRAGRLAVAVALGALALRVRALAATAAALLLARRRRGGLHVRGDLADERGDGSGDAAVTCCAVAVIAALRSSAATSSRWVGQHEGDDVALGAGARGAAGAVQVRLVLGGRVDVHDELDVVDVHAAGGDIGRDQHARGAGARTRRGCGRAAAATGCRAGRPPGCRLRSAAWRASWRGAWCA